VQKLLKLIFIISLPTILARTGFRFQIFYTYLTRGCGDIVNPILKRQDFAHAENEINQSGKTVAKKDKKDLFK